MSDDTTLAGTPVTEEPEVAAEPTEEAPVEEATATTEEAPAVEAAA